MSLLATAPAQAIVMNFESLAVNTNSNINNVGTTYTESGFTVSQVGIQVEAEQLAVFGTLNSRSPGSTALFNNSFTSGTRLTQVGGGAFNLSSIDLSSVETSSTVVSFTGRRLNNSTITQSFLTDAVLSTLQTFNFNNFTNLVAVDWSQSAPFHQFDNINVSAVGGTTAVPEPFTILGTLFGVGSSVVMKRRLAKATADKRSID